MIALAVLIAGGTEMRLALRKYSRRARRLESRVLALEIGRTLPDDITGETTPLMVPAISIPPHARRHHHPMGLWLLLIAGLLLAGGCTQAQIDRAQLLADASDAKLVAAAQAEDAARATLATAQQLADASNSDKAKAAVAAANAALDVATATTAVAKSAAAAGHQAVDAATAAQAAGSSTFNVLVAAAAALVPTVGGLVAAIAAAVKAGQAFRQTVAGVDNAKKSMPPEAVAALHIELAKAQDESTKVAVDKAQAAGAAKGT